MPKFNQLNALASATALLLLLALVAVAAWVVAPIDRFWSTAVIGSLLTVPVALAAWGARLNGRNRLAMYEPKTWKDWIGVFFVGLAISGAFTLIDLAVGHPGVSLVFTAGAVALTFVALPSAVRAWLLQALTMRGKQ